MSNVGIFVDTCDLYRKVQRNFGRGSKISFDIFLDFIAGGSWEIGVAYGMRSESQGFPNYLKVLGFTPKFKPPRVYEIGDRKIKKCDWNIMLVMDVIQGVDDHGLNTVVLGSSNGLLLPLVNYLRESGVEVIIVASGIPYVLRKSADSYCEITAEHLEVLEESL